MDVGDFIQLTFAAAAVLIAWVQYELMTTQMEIMRKQTWLMDRQLEIDEQQNTIIQENLKRKAVLNLTLKMPSYNADTGAAVIEVFAKNIGNRSASDFFWHMAVPQLPGVGISADGLGSFKGHLNPEVQHHAGLAHLVYKGMVNTTTYPTRHRGLCRLHVSGLPKGQPPMLRYKLVWEDGLSPPGDGYGLMLLDVATIDTSPESPTE